MKTEAEMTMIQPQDKEPPRATGSWKRQEFTPEASRREHGPADTLISDIWLPALERA